MSQSEPLNKAKILLRRLLKASGELQTAIPGLTCGRRDEIGPPCNSLPEPFVTLLVEGSKTTSYPGDRPLQYHQGQCLVSGVTSPNAASFHCSLSDPLLFITLRLDYQIINDLLDKLPNFAQRPRDLHMCPAVVIDATPELEDAYVRLMELLDSPERIDILAPLIKQEIHYYLLMSAAGSMLSGFALSGVVPNQLARSINYLKENYQQPIFVEDLAKMVHMAPSTFFRHFKAMFGLTPMQYHKQLRLFAARKMLWQQQGSVSQIAYEVGYESASQFSRDYKKLFGLTPTAERSPEHKTDEA